MSNTLAAPIDASFWQRQFDARPTTTQYVFDLIFGFALPLACLYFDPFVFRADFGQPLLGRIAIVGKVAIGLGWLSLTTWFVVRRPAALYVGLLAGGAIFAGLLGLVLLPFSLIGLLAGIGVLGLTPFATSFVFARNAVRASRQVPTTRAVNSFLLPAFVGLAVTCLGPWVAQVVVRKVVSRATAMALSTDTVRATRGVGVLKRLCWLDNLDQLVVAYEREDSPDRRAALAASYREITGREIEDRLVILRD